VPPLVIFFLMKKRYDILFSPYMFLAALIALIFITPVIYWNINHDFISFRYQGSHVFGSFAASAANFLESIAAQFGAYSPFLFIVAFYGFFKSIKNKNDYVRLAVLFGGAIILFFVSTSLLEKTLPHWPGIFYLLFIPIGTYTLLQSQGKGEVYFFCILNMLFYFCIFHILYMLFCLLLIPSVDYLFRSPIKLTWEMFFLYILYVLIILVGVYILFIFKEKLKRYFEKSKRYFLYFAIGFSLIVMLFAYVEVAGKYFAFPDYKSPFRDIYGFPAILKQADGIIKLNASLAPKAIAVSNWTMGSRTMYYNLPYHNEVFVIDDRQDQFDIWQKKSPVGYDLLFLNTHFNNMDIGKDVICERTDVAGKADILLNGAKVDTVEFVWCRNYQGMKQ